MDHPDNILFQEVKQDDFESFNKLFNKYYRGLCAYAYNIVEEHTQAEDIVQEVFIKIWENRSELNIHSSIKSYLFNSVRNSSINTVKILNNRKSITEILRHKSISFELNNKYETEELRAVLSNCIEELPPRCLEVFKLSRFEEQKQSKIAENLDISIKTVKAQIGKALAYLKQCLDRNYFLPEKKSQPA